MYLHIEWQPGQAINLPCRQCCGYTKELQVLEVAAESVYHFTSTVSVVRVRGLLLFFVLVPG